MAKFYGEIGFGVTEDEDSDGAWIDGLTERLYFGDIVKNVKRADEGDKVNDDISLQNSISIVADAYANEHFFAIRYAKWQGALWKVSTVEVQSPRLILRLGGIYNGPTPIPTP